MNLRIDHSVAKKLREKHDVEKTEIEECFLNREHGFLSDTREEHKTFPPTFWFIGETDTGRKIKVCFMISGETFVIKTAFTPDNEDVVTMYFRKAAKI